MPTPRIVSVIRERGMAKVMLLYAAGAWVAVEIVGFLAETYGWPRRYLDLAVLLAAAGALAALVLSWYHGPSGQQEVVRSERVTLFVLVGLTATMAAWLLLRDPTARFEALVGHRVIIDFPPRDLNELRFSWTPEAAGEFTENGSLIFEPEKLDFEVPGVRMTSLGASVRFQYQELDRPRLWIVLPRVPDPLKSAPTNLADSVPLYVETLDLVLHVQRSALVRRFVDSTLIVVEDSGPP